MIRTSRRYHRRRLTVAGATVIGLVALIICVSWVWRSSGPHIMITSNNLGSVSGGTIMIITGNGFSKTGTTHVYFGSAEATKVDVTAPTTIVATTPAHAAGKVTVTVVNPDGRRAAQTNAFTFDALKPIITAISPAVGAVAGGTFVTVHGHGFTASPVKVHVHTTEVEPAVIDDSTLTFITPPQAKPIQVNVSVIVPGTALSSDSANYEYQ